MSVRSGYAGNGSTLIGRGPIVEGIRRLLAGGDRLRRRVVLLSGEAGIGKSRVAAEAGAYAAGRGFLVLEGGCFPQDRASLFAPLLDLVRSRLAGDRSGSFRERAGAYTDELEPLLPDLFPSPRVPEHSSEPDPEQARRRLFEGFTHLLGDDAGPRPVLIVIEDLHWCDEASLDALLHLMRRTAGRPLYLIVTFRSDEADTALRRWLGDLDRERVALEFPVTPLAHDEVSALVRTILGQEQPVPAAFVDAIDGLAEGNPFFVEELVGSLIAQGGPRPTEDLRRFAGIPAAGWRIPRSIHACVLQRVLRIGPAAQEVLRLAAVVGRRFDYGLLQHVAGLDERTLVTLIRELVGANLVVEESPDVFTFRHALIQQAVYGELLGRERIALHRTVAEYAEEVFDATTEQRLSELAYHFFQAEMWDKALVYARRAGEQANRLYAPRVAVEQFTRALAAADRLTSVEGEESRDLIDSLLPGLHGGRGRAHEMLGDFERARDDYEAAAELAARSADRRAELKALLDLGLLWAGRDYAMAQTHLDRALSLARTLGDPALIARSLNRVGNCQVNTSEPSQALSYHREALSLFEQLGDRRGIAETLDLLGVAYFLTADLPASLSHYERALELYRALDDRTGLVTSLAMLATRAGAYEIDSFDIDTGEIARGIEQAEEAIRIARAIDWRSGEAFALFQCSSIVGPRGDYRRALDDAERSLRLADEIGHAQWQSGALTMLTSLYLDLLSTDDARQHAERARSLAIAIGSSFWIQYTTYLLAQAFMLDRDTKRAAVLLDGSPDSDDDAPIRSLGRWYTNAARIELALRSGRPADALRLLDLAARPDPEGPATRETPRLALFRTLSLSQLGRLDEAAALLVRLRDSAEAKGARSLLWRVLVALGDLSRTRGEQDAARQYFTAARVLIEELAGTIPDERLRGTFLRNATTMLPKSYRLSAQRVAAAQAGGLTARERQVAMLVGRGHSNREIARELVLGERTIETHVSNILVKLGAGSRQEIAAWVTAQDTATGGSMPPAL